MVIISTPFLATQLLEIYKGREEMMNGMWQRLTCGRSSVPTRKISRRAVVVGTAGVATAAIVGEGAFWLMRQSLQSIPQGTRLVTYRGHSEGVRSARWSPNGMRIASASYGHTVQVWQAV